MELFLSDISFFIQQENKYQDEQIISYIMSLMDNLLVKEQFFIDNLGAIKLAKGQLFIYPDIMSEFTEKNLVSELNKQPVEKVIFSPSSYSEWENKTVYFTDISSILSSELTNKLSSEERKLYDNNVLPILKKFIVRNYYVNDPDGFTNLRKEPNTDSVIISKIINNSYVCFINDSNNNWCYVYVLGYGYMHKIKLIEV